MSASTSEQQPMVVHKTHFAEAAPEDTTHRPVPPAAATDRDETLSVAASTAAPPSAAAEVPEPELDFQVGVWRGTWPPAITCIICVDANHIVRYFSSQRILDLAAFDSERNVFVTIAETSLGTHELPPLVSIHHFDVRGEPCIIGLAEDRRRFAIFKIADHRFHPSTVGSLPHTTTHLVMFKYRAMHYALCYNAGLGDYTVLSMAPLVAGEIQAATVSRGRFRQGWSDVVWKGTHHVRCTRQRFFCYSSATGEVAFECVYVRGGSTSSSVCSAEHVQMAAKESDHPMQTTLKRKGCIAVPLQLAGRLVCLLYTHSALKAPGSHDKSTSRLPTGQYGVGATTNVAASASLLLEKKIFAHTEPWTHFCVLGLGATKDGGVGEHLLCYSALSGEVWVNRIFHSTAPVKVVTLLNDGLPTHGPDAHIGDSKRRSSKRKGGGDGSRHLTQEALGKVGVEPLSVEHYTRSLPADQQHHQASSSRSGSPHSVHHESSRRAKDSGGDDGADAADGTPAGGGGGGPTAGNRMSSARSRRSDKESFMTPLQPRPPSSSRTLRERLAALKTTGDYHADITRVLQELQRLDFPGNSPAIQLALDDVPQLVPEAADGPLTPAALSRSRRRAASARSGADGKPPWVNVSGLHERSPPPRDSWLIKFEEEYERHRLEEVPAMKLEHKSMMRLYKPPLTREDYQTKQLDAIYKALARKMVGANKDDPNQPVPPPDGRAVMKTVKRLGVDDIQTREKRREQIHQKYAFHPPPAKKLDDEDQQTLTKRLSDDAVAAHAKREDQLRRKYYAPLEHAIPVPPPLSPEQQKALAKRLVDDALERQATKRDRVFHEMNDGHTPRTATRSPEQISVGAARLAKGESAIDHGTPRRAAS